MSDEPLEPSGSSAHAVTAIPAGRRSGATRDRTVAWVDAHPGSLLTLFFAARFMLLLARMAVFHRFQEGTPYTYVQDRDYAAQSDHGAYPFLNYWMEYPPAFPWLAVLLYRLTTLAGPAHALTFYFALGLVFILADTGILICVYQLARLANGRAAAPRAALLYGLLSVPTYLYSGWFDTVPALLLLVAAILLFEHRLNRSAVIVGIGVMTKLFPIVLVPVAWRWLGGWTRAARYTALVGLTGAAIALPFLLAAPRYTGAFLAVTSRQRPWETVWALWDGYYGFGAFPGFPERYKAATAAGLSYPTHYSLLLFLVILGALLLFVYGRTPRLICPREGVALLMITLSLTMLVYKGYSPQYLIWLLPLVFVVLPPATAAVLAVLLQAVNLVEYPVFFHWFAGRWNGLLVLIVIARMILLAALALAGYRVISQASVPRLSSAPRPAHDR